MASVISLWCGIFLGFNSKNFGICDFLGAKGSGKVFMIIIYYFYNHYKVLNKYSSNIRLDAVVKLPR